jgi:hypothetical protein
VIDSDDECNARTKKRLCTKPIKGWNTHQTQTDKIKCAWTLSVRRPLVNHVGGKPDKKSVEPDVQEDVDAEYKSGGFKKILVEKTRNPKISLF